MITGKFPSLRLRRNRKNDWTRRLVQENTLSANDFILPIFIIDGKMVKFIILNQNTLEKNVKNKITKVNIVNHSKIVKRKNFYIIQINRVNHMMYILIKTPAIQYLLNIQPSAMLKILLKI